MIERFGPNPFPLGGSYGLPFGRSGANQSGNPVPAQARGRPSHCSRPKASLPSRPAERSGDGQSPSPVSGSPCLSADDPLEACARLRARLQSLGRAQASKPILKIVPCAGCPGLQPALLPRSALGPGFFLSLVTTKAPSADAQAADGAFIFILRASPSDACRKCRPAFYVEAAALTSVRARTSQRVRLHGGRRPRCRRRRCRRGG